MKAKKIVIKTLMIGVAVIISIAASSQTLKETIRMAENERYERAKESFRNLVNTDPNKAMVYFYFGETYFNQEMYDSADIMYKNGINADSSFVLNYVGVGKILWNGNYQNQSETFFNKAISKTKSKNALVLMLIAENYINAQNKNLPY